MSRAAAPPAASRHADTPAASRHAGLPSLLPRAVLALAVAAVALGFAIAGRAERLSGAEPTLRFEVAVPFAALDTHRPEALERIWRQRLSDHAITIAPGPDRGGALRVEIEVAGARAEDAPGIARALSLSGAMAMRWVANDTPTARRWYQALHDRDAVFGDGTVHAYSDAWFVDRTGDDWVDYFVVGPDRAAIAAAIAALGPDAAPPDDLELMYEDIPRSVDPDGDGHAAYVRTYLVERAVILDQTAVDDARVSYDPNTMRPEVAVMFTRAGGRAFGDATAGGIGRKLAIIVDGNVTSAPIVQGAIHGGRSTITMGGGDAARDELEAQGLAAALTGGGEPLPPGLHAKLVAAASAAGARWLTRLGLALLAGVLAWLAAAALARHTELAPVPLVDPPTPPPGDRRPRAWGATAVAVAVTVGLPALLIYVARNVALPGLTPAIYDLMAKGRAGDDLTQISIFALGILPLVSAFWLVELIALLVPRWRRARLGTPADRRTLDRVALGVTVALAFLQAWFILQYFDAMADRGHPVIGSGVLPRVALIASLVAGVLVHVVAAELITRHGLANGVLVLLAVGFAWRFVEHPPRSATDPMALACAVMAAVAVLAAVLARLRPRGGRRLPWGGVVPGAVPAVVIALFTLVALAWTSAWRVFDDYWARALWIDAIIAIPVVGLIAWARRADWRPVPALLSLGFVLALVLSPALVDPSYRRAVTVVQAALLGVAVLELAVGIRARLRLPRAIAVYATHDVDRADRVGDALAAAGIEHALVGVHARAVLRLFGSYCPILVRVAGDAAARAADIIATDGAVYAAAAPRADVLPAAEVVAGA